MITILYSHDLKQNSGIKYSRKKRNLQYLKCENAMWLDFVISGPKWMLIFKGIQNLFKMWKSYVL